MEKCKNIAQFRYTWPGKNKARICGTHAAQIRVIADAMGMNQQFIPLTQEEMIKDPDCHQNVKEEPNGDKADTPNP